MHIGISSSLGGARFLREKEMKEAITMCAHVEFSWALLLGPYLKN